MDNIDLDFCFFLPKKNTAYFVLKICTRVEQIIVYTLLIFFVEIFNELEGACLPKKTHSWFSSVNTVSSGAFFLSSNSFVIASNDLIQHRVAWCTGGESKPVVSSKSRQVINPGA
jgi:hypothetical protein